MNDLAKKWIAALRSGKYKRVRGQLELSEQYCCLGVACVVADQEGIHAARFPTGTLKGFTILCSSQAHIGTALGLTLEGERRCVVMNDTDNLTFPEIADKLETNPELFFKQETTVEQPSQEMD